LSLEATASIQEAENAQKAGWLSSYTVPRPVSIKLTWVRFSFRLFS